MGFIFNPKIVPKALVNSFMKAFSRLPQKFIVKFEGEMDYVPPNVKILDFVPQQSILGTRIMQNCSCLICSVSKLLTLKFCFSPCKDKSVLDTLWSSWSHGGNLLWRPNGWSSHFHRSGM